MHTLYKQIVLNIYILLFTQYKKAELNKTASKAKLGRVDTPKQMEKKVKIFFTLSIIFAIVIFAENENAINNFFQETDANGDGKITIEELNDSNAFKILDKNNDGIITKNELDPNSSEQVDIDTDNKKNRKFVKFDTNSDGKISLEEWPINREAFLRLDKNKDGYISFGEMPNKKEMKRFRNAKGSIKILDRLDKNDDQKISKAEWRGPDKIFVHFDKNKDGFLTKKEIPNKNKSQKGKRMFQFLDLNKDHEISKDEWRGDIQKFNKLDKNGDGVISPQDFERKNKFENHFFKKILKKLDANGDQKIDANEWPRKMKFFKKIDQNNDGFLEEKEFNKHKKQHNFKRLHFDRKNGSSKKEFNKRQKQNKLKRLDIDGDGRISENEWPGKIERFERMDKNGDGFITEEDQR